MDAEMRELASSLREGDEDAVLLRIVSIASGRIAGPWKMYLFGSRAAGNPRFDSDYDIMLVTSRERFQRLHDEARLLFAPVAGAVDISATTPGSFRVIAGDDRIFLWAAPGSK